MSKPAKTRVTCPHCGAESSQLTYGSIDVTLEPKLKKKLLSGDVFRFICPSCARESAAHHDCLVHDAKREFLIQLTTEADAEALRARLQRATDAKPAQAGWRLRIVTDVDDLLEKVLIFDAKLNDGVVEFLKVAAPVSVPGLAGAALRFEGVDEKKNLTFVAFRDGHAPAYATIPRSIYDDMRTGPCADLAKHARKGGEWRVIDRDAVLELVAPKR